MNYLDIIISVSSLYALIKGFSNGIIKEITNIISIFLAIYTGVHFSKLIKPYLYSELSGDYEKIIPLIAFLIIFVIVLIIIKTTGKLIDRLTKLLALGLINRFLGAVFGLFKLVVILSFLLSLAMQHDLINKENQQQSILIIPLKEISEVIIPKINKHKKNIIETTQESTEKVKETLGKKINSE
jgi:membrane protein required for colicin V production